MVKIYIENQSHEYPIEMKHLKFVNYCYAHGDLQDKAGFDLISELKSNHFDGRKNINGEECVAVLPDGTEVPALYFRWKSVQVFKDTYYGETFRWTRTQFRGLLVAKDDDWAIKDAQKKYNERASCL